MFMPEAPSARAEGDLQFFGGARQQDHVGHVVFAGMSAAFKAVDADGVATDLFRFQRVPNGGAFVDDLDAGRL
jgi:hypothetical protein